MQWRSWLPCHPWNSRLRSTTCRFRCLTIVAQRPICSSSSGDGLFFSKQHRYKIIPEKPKNSGARYLPTKYSAAASWCWWRSPRGRSRAPSAAARCDLSSHAKCPAKKNPKTKMMKTSERTASSRIENKEKVQFCIRSRHTKSSFVQLNSS